MVSYMARTEVLDSGAGELDRVTQALANSLQQLHATAQRYMAANEGHTIENYGTAHTMWSQGMQEMESSLGQAKLDLMMINQNYIGVDQRNAARMPSGRA